MDRLFKKRTTSSGGSRNRERANSHQQREREKDKERDSNHGRSKEKENDNGLNALASPTCTTSTTSPSITRSPSVDKNLPPSIELDLRTSLILPSLSQRFSVLLPSLSAAPESSLRSLIASQRARPDGPSLTLEEEELLVAEIRQGGGDAEYDDWDGQPPDFDFGTNSHAAGDSIRRALGSGMTNSLSSPSVLLRVASSEMPLTGSNSTMSVVIPPPTSNSFSSFHTFGETSTASSSLSPSPNNFYTSSNSGVNGGTGGVGFGRSALRDGEYRRRVQRNATQKNQSNSSSSTLDLSKEALEGSIVSQGPKVTLSPISPEKANASYVSTKQAQAAPSIAPSLLRPDSPNSEFERGNTPTPTPSAFGSTTSLNRLRRAPGSPSVSSTLNLPPQLPPPAGLPPPPPPQSNGTTSATPSTPSPSSSPVNGKRRKRQSMMVGMSAAQMKRISRALIEIESQLEQENVLRRGGQGVGTRPSLEDDEEANKVELMTQTPPQKSPKQLRKHLRTESEGSQMGLVLSVTERECEKDEHTSSASASAVSSVFPFNISPSHSSHAGTSSVAGSGSGSASIGAGTPPTSIPRSLPSSPRSHNLFSQTEPSSSTENSTPRTPQSKEQPPLPPFPLSCSPPRSATSAGTQQPFSTPVAVVMDDSGYLTGSEPRPALTPYRPQPVRHTPSGSISSTSQASSPMPGYVPGQVRPVGSSHRTNPSTSSRSFTPTAGMASPAVSSSLSATTSSPSTQTHMRSGSSPSSHVESLSATLDILNRSPSLGHSVGSNTRRDVAPGFGSSSSTDSPVQVSALSLNTPVTPQTIAEAEENGMESPLPVPSPTFSTVNTLDAASGARSDSFFSSDVSSQHPNLGHDDPRQHSHAYSISLTPPSATMSASASTASVSAKRSGSSMLTSPPSTLRHVESTESMDSAYKEVKVGENWAEVFDGPSSPFDDVVMTPHDVRGDAEMLRKYSGVGREELSLIQDRLVERAKIERQQLRSMDDPPSFPNSPGLNQPLAHPETSNMATSQQQNFSTYQSPPPTAWRFHQSSTSIATSRTISPVGTRSQPLSPVILGPPAHLTQPKNVDHSVSGATFGAGIAPQQHSVPNLTQNSDTPTHEHIHTPASTFSVGPGPHKTFSQELEHEREKGRDRRRLDEDPEVRRDFEERIAAATAALHRTPSRGAKYDRKNSGSAKLQKSGAPLIISSPTLMSSSIHLPTTPRTPNTSASNTTIPHQQAIVDHDLRTGQSHARAHTPEHDAAVARALEKASGSSTKMGTRWRKLAGFKRNPSIANADPSSLMTMPPRSLGQNTLEEPIALKKGEGSSAPANMSTFRFPPPESTRIASPPNTADVVMPMMKASIHSEQRNKVDPLVSSPSQFQSIPIRKETLKTTVTATETQAAAQKLNVLDEKNQVSNTQSSSEHSAITQFLRAGRAVGLEEDKLQEMLSASGMIDRSESTKSSHSTQLNSTEASPSSPNSPTTATMINRAPSMEKPSRSLFRVLSKNRRAAAAAAAKSGGAAFANGDASSSVPGATATPAHTEPRGQFTSGSDSSILRRTMIFSNDFRVISADPPKSPSSAAPAVAHGTPTTPQGSFSQVFSDHSGGDHNAMGTGVGLGIGLGLGPASKVGSGGGTPMQSTRKPSIKRKPLKLTGADRELVQRSPSVHRRNPSGQTNTSMIYEENENSSNNNNDSDNDVKVDDKSHGDDHCLNGTPTVNEVEKTPRGLPPRNLMEFGLGFLSSSSDHTGPNSARSSGSGLPSPGLGSSADRVSSTIGGSFYDYYNHDNDIDERDDDNEMNNSNIDNNSNSDETNNEHINVRSEHLGRNGDANLNDVINSITTEAGSDQVKQEEDDGQAGGEEIVMAPPNQGVEITEYADGRVAWSIVDALRDDVVAQARRESGLTYDSPYFSDASDRDRPESEASISSPHKNVSTSRWETTPGFSNAGLQLRHRDRNEFGPRPPTKVFYTSSADVADLIDQLSRDTLGATRGRIDIVPSQHKQSRPPSESQFSDAPSLISTRRQHQPLTPISPAKHQNLQSHHHHGSSGSGRVLTPTSAAAFVPAGGFSPKRQMFLRQHQNAVHRRNNSTSSGNEFNLGLSSSSGITLDSPSAASFFSDGSGSNQGKSVEERLQALMDRLCVEPGVVIGAGRQDKTIGTSRQ